MKKNNFYITATLPSVNAPLHIGHALELVRADIIARYKRLIGYNVYFNTGTDEYGIKIYEKAKEKQMNTQDFVDQGFITFKEQLKIFGIDDVHLIRTTDKNHQKAAQEFWKLVKKNGYIYKKNYQSKYCVGCESGKTDSDLIDGECKEHPGVKLHLINEENYFFKYSAFTNELLNLYKKNPSFIVPEFRFNEIKNFVENGLQDFSISRLKAKMPWGIPVPDDPLHVMYVWFDALVSYISSLGWPKTNAKSICSAELTQGVSFRPDKDDNFHKYWVHGNPTQYCGKDNTRFQGAMWQAMLMAAGLPNSHQIVVNGFITGEGGVRMSKTLGNVIDPREIVNEYSTDALRYFLAREVGSFEDSPFTLERFKEAYNANLANGLGNLVSRIMKMAQTNLSNSPEILENTIPENWKEAMEDFNIKKASDVVFSHITELDQMIQLKKPFKLVKEDKEKGEKILNHLVSSLYTIGRMLNPIMPETSKIIKELVKKNKMPSSPLFPRKE